MRYDIDPELAAAHGQHGIDPTRIGLAGVSGGGATATAATVATWHAYLRRHLHG